MSARLPRCAAGGAVAVLLLLMPCARLAAAAVPDATRFRDRPDDWFKTDEGQRIVDNILTWQNPNGGWWKAYDPANPRPPKDAPPDPKDPSARGDTMDVWHRTSTFDNDATSTELRILARAFRVTGDP